MTEGAAQMSLKDSETLQSEIDRLHAGERPAIYKIVLDHGSEDTDLSSCVDVRVYRNDDIHFTVYTFATVSWLNKLFSDTERVQNNPNTGQLFCTGGPLCILPSITALGIVTSIKKYLALSNNRAGH
jgi:hypothetical protein